MSNIKVIQVFAKINTKLKVIKGFKGFARWPVLVQDKWSFQSKRYFVLFLKKTYGHPLDTLLSGAFAVFLSLSICI